MPQITDKKKKIFLTPKNCNKRNIHRLLRNILNRANNIHKHCSMALTITTRPEIFNAYCVCEKRMILNKLNEGPYVMVLILVPEAAEFPKLFCDLTPKVSNSM